MSNPIIEVSGLSKQYRIDTRLPYKSLRETIMNVVTSPARLLRHSMPSALCFMLPSEDGYIWALKDVSFEVKQGEVLGIIGRNGAGKLHYSKFYQESQNLCATGIRFKPRGI
jgi:lipopolysaccharide transport system ATP-binding protein